MGPFFPGSDFQPSILIVDDNPRNLQVMSAVLKQKGYKLYLTNSGENTLQFLEQTLPDMILLDVMMPGMSGFEVCRIIKAQERYSEIPVAFLTAKNDVEDIIKGFEVGAVDYITKPFHAQEVYVRISNHLQLKFANQLLREKNLMLEQLNQSLLESKSIIEQDARELSLLNAEKNRFFSIIAHDLRGPFSGLVGLSEILFSQIDELAVGEIREMVEAMHNSSGKVFALLENLLNWSRIQMNTLEINPQPLLPHPILLETIEIFQPQASSKEIAIQIEGDPLAGLFADLNMLKTIFRNLISNAIKFSHRGGTITITIENIGNEMTRIGVRDAGIGMEPALVQKLFALDQRVMRPGTEGEASSGLGLLLSKDMALKNGGDILVESQLGKGSLLSLILPAREKN